MLAVLPLRHRLTLPVHPPFLSVFCWSNDYETVFELALKLAINLLFSSQATV